VESDPELLAEVDRLRSARALLSVVEPAPISMREEHLAGALAAWDRIPASERTGATRDLTPDGISGAAAAGAASVTAPTRLADRRRTTSTRWLTAAAAALVLVLAGGVVLQLNTGSDDDSTSSDALSATTDAADAADAAGSNAELRSEELDVAAAESAADEFADSDTDGTQLDTGINTPAPPQDADLVVLLTPQDLASFAADSIDAPAVLDVPAATSASPDLSEDEQDFVDEAFPLCLGVDDIVGPAWYDSVYVVVGIDVSRDVAIAYTVPDCDEVALVRLP
jgi:hypothetical protein